MKSFIPPAALLAVSLAISQTVSSPPMSGETDSLSSGSFDSTRALHNPFGFQHLTHDEIVSLPFRGTENYLPLFPGVVQQDGEFHIRGGRSGELGYLIEGMGATNRFTNENGVPVIPEAMEQFDVSAGGYSAEFGGWNSGLVNTRLRTGGDRWSFSGSLQTDDLAKPGEKFIGTSSFGYRDAVFTAGGPFPSLNDLRLFVAAENVFKRDRQPMFFSPFSLNPATDMFDPHPGEALPSPIFFKENSIPNNWSDATTVQGSASYKLNSLDIRVVGSFDTRRQPQGSEWPDALVRFFDQKRTPLDKVNSEFLSVRATHSLSPSTSYDLAVSYYGRSSNTLDPDFDDDWRSYSDSLTNAAHGYSGFLSRWYGPPQYSIIDGFYLDNQNTPNTTYRKEKQQRWTFAGSFSSEVNEHWRVKVGGDVETWTMRLFNVGYVPGLMSFQYGVHGEYQRTFPDPITRRAFLTRAGLINNYGYDVDGNETNGGLDAPRTPVFVSAFVQNDIDLEGFSLGLGLRFERYDLRDATFIGMTNYNILLDAIDDTRLANREPSSFLLPRLSLSYAADEKTLLYAQFGAYAQQPSLNQIFSGNIILSRTVMGDRPYATPAGYYAKPERTNLVQMGISRELSPTLKLTALLYIKQMNNLLSVRKVYLPDWYGGFNGYLNEDHAIAKGLELGLELIRSRGVAAHLFYSISEVRGINSTPLSPFGAVEAHQPLNLNDDPLGFNRTHNVTCSFDFLSPDTSRGSILSGLGMNIVLSFNSGHNFTRVAPVGSIGLADSWRAGVSQILDPRYARPAESRNSSVSPAFFNVDLAVSKRFLLATLSVRAYVNVLNLFNAKQVVNVYPVTGSADNDGWLQNPLSEAYLNTPAAVDFYRTINLQNRWAYMQATGNDIYGSPRQIRIGLSVAL